MKLNGSFIMAALCVADADIIFLPCGFYLSSFGSLKIQDAKNLEMQDPKPPKIRRLGTIAQLCRVIS